ncbi:MAG: DUF4124 domain-containing protein [Gammaproteobacteria bacterium]|nr:DUF4124 domain-containing protein [Gammaproteobacteria bacterium]
MKRYVVLLLCLAWLGQAQGAGIYKWVDEKGKVHYGDRPGNSGAQEVTVKPAPPQDSGLREREDKQQRLLKSLEQDRKQTEQARDQARADKIRSEQECKMAKVRLKSYEQAGYFYADESDGKKRILSNEESKDSLEKARKAVDYWCK